MRSRSPILAITAVAAITVLVACTPDENEPVLQTAAEVKTTASPSGNYLAGRQAQINRDSQRLAFWARPERKPGKYAATPKHLWRAWRMGTLAVPMAREIVKRGNRGNPKLILLVDAVERDDLAAADKLLAGFPDGGFAGFIKPLKPWSRFEGDTTARFVAPKKPVRPAHSLRTARGAAVRCRGSYGRGKVL